MNKIRHRTTILGVNVDVLSKDELIEKMQIILEQDNGSYVFTPNAEILYRAYKDKEYRKILNSASLLIPDGSGVALASKLKAEPIPSRLCGIDLAMDTLKYAAGRGYSVFLLGGKKGIAEKAADHLRAEIPTLKICGTHHGYFNKTTDSTENLDVCRKINASSPHLLFVCFGAPAQEIWIYENLKDLPSVRLAAGLGGSLDVWAGNVRRAPRIVQKSGLEWLYRAIRQPSRTKRIPSLWGFCCAVTVENIKMGYPK